MSTFITPADYPRFIRAEVLARLLDGDDTLLELVETDAIGLMAGYLNTRYDTAIIFAATGDDRNPIILKYAIDIALFNLYGRAMPEQVPELRKENMAEAERWLTRVCKGLVDPPDLPRPVEATKDFIKYGSNPPRQNHI